MVLFDKTYFLFLQNSFNSILKINIINLQIALTQEVVTRSA